MNVFLKSVVALLLTLVVFPAGAYALTFNLDVTNDNNTGTSGPWATVSLTDSTFNGNDSVHFEVTAIETAFSSRGDNFGIQNFYFNENTSFGSSLLIGGSPTGWNYLYQEDNFYSPGNYGKFEFIFAGNGSTRVNPLLFDVYTDDNTPLTIANFSTSFSTDENGGYLFASHIAGYGPEGELSAKFATQGTPGAPPHEEPPPVPEPATFLLLGSGLAGLAFYRRKKR